MSKYYAVDGRPVQIIEQPGGGAECLALDMTNGTFVADRSYLDAQPPGEELTAPIFAQRVATVRVDLVRTWAERLAHATSTDEAGLTAAIGVPLSPAPLGATRVIVRGGMVPKIELELPPSVFIRGDFEARLGQGNQLPLTGAYATYQVAYLIAPAGAPRRCTVIASFQDRPVEDTPSTGVLLRVDG